MDPPELHPSVRSVAPSAPVSLPTFTDTWQPIGAPGSVGQPPPSMPRTMPSTDFSAATPTSSTTQHRSHILRWVALLATLLVAATVGLVVPNLTNAAASGWTDQSLQVVGSPIDVGGVVVILNVNSNHEMELSGISPTSGAVIWSHPYSVSQITPGVAFTPVAIGDAVLLAAPASGARDPLVMVKGIDGVTGRVLWTLPQSLVLSDAPVTCASGSYFCIPAFVAQTKTDLIALNPTSGAVVGTVPGPFRNMAVAPPGSQNDSDLWQTTAQTPTFTQTSASGQVLWTQTVANLFGGSQFDPDFGWDFVVTGNLDIGSVGVAPVGKTEALDGFKTVGISNTSGAVAWSVPGYFLCGGGLQFLTSDLVCQYTGTARESGQSETMAGVGLTLQGLNPTSGATTWSKAVLNPKSISDGTNVAFADGAHLVVQLVGGQRVVLDVNDGSTSSPSANEVFWCEKIPIYRVVTAPEASTSGKRVGEPVYQSCSSTGATVSGTPTTMPSTVGMTVNGMFIWPTPNGLRAEPSPGSA